LLERFSLIQNTTKT